MQQAHQKRTTKYGLQRWAFKTPRAPELSSNPLMTFQKNKRVEERENARSLAQVRFDVTSSVLGSLQMDAPLLQCCVVPGPGRRWAPRG